MRPRAAACAHGHPYTSEVTDKATMYQLYEQCAFGNRFRMWPSLEELHNCGDAPTVVSFRHRGDLPSRPCWVNIPLRDVDNAMARWLDLFGPHPPHITESIAEIPKVTKLNAELMMRPAGIHMYFSTAPLVMREALATDGRFADGIRALALLCRFLWPSSLEDLRELLAVYQDHVIELTAYDREVGWAQGRNAVIWEVRKY